MEDGTIFRIKRSEYDYYYNKLRLIEKITNDEDDLRHHLKFFSQDNYPTVEDLEKHDIKNNLDKYYIYLMYYKYPELYNNDDDEFKETRKYIDKCFNKYLVIIEDEDIEKIKNISKEEWEEFNDLQKLEALEPLIIYYKQDEFEQFYDDLGFQNFMFAYGKTKKAYKSNRTKKAIKKIFDSFFKNIES